MATGRLSVPSEAGRLTGESSSVSARAGAFMMKSESPTEAHPVPVRRCFLHFGTETVFVANTLCWIFISEFPELEPGTIFLVPKVTSEVIILDQSVYILMFFGTDRLVTDQSQSQSSG